MNPYERYLFPLIMDLACGTKDFAELRAALVPRAQGRVLEIGVGTGHNLKYYDTSKVDELIALDPAQQMHSKAQRRADEAGVDVDVRSVSAEGIPLPDDDVDSVVITFTLCSIPDVASAVTEMRRVLKPGGELIFVEHGLAPDESVKKWQHRLNPIQNRVAAGCNLDRDIPSILRSDFELAELSESYIPGPKFIGYVYSGVAT